MQDQKIDYYLLIGTIISILIVFFCLKKPFNEIGSKNIQLSNNINKTILFSPKKYGETILENDLIRVKISNLGGNISEIFLKKYKTYNDKILRLVKTKSFTFGLNLITLSGKKVDSNDWLFTPNLQETPYQYILTMKTIFPPGGELNYIYSLPKEKSYEVNFSITSRGLCSFAINNAIFFNCKQKLIGLEKNYSYENNYAQMCYSYGKNKKIKSLSEIRPDQNIVKKINWIANKQQFFTTIFFPKNTFQTTKIQSKRLTSPFYIKWGSMFSPLELVDNELNWKAKWDFVPLKYNLLKKYGDNFEDIIPFGWRIFRSINKNFFLKLLQFLEKTKLNYGVIIILMTIIVKLILFPITYWQCKFIAIMKMRRSDIEELNEKLKDADPFQKQQATIEFYKQIGINPMSVFFPAIFQIPIFYALFKFFPNIINLRGKSFLWAYDLTYYDSVFHLPLTIPIYGNHVSLFTLFYIFAFILYTKFSHINNYGNNNRLLKYFMPIIMLLFINNYASGLSLYYFISNILNLIILFLIKKKKITKYILRNN
ncbi:YidC/Oxa1 family insertase periplasmic-domain containing protein [Candidatus Walczuchella monophlebidarum]|uniref:Membrane protein insertase YidC n=1 Tax=Candidatus Walczuchella monophlebidarum TaxID=1415657 RepID=A0A068DWF0_9FLAO|nr:YidC/Oxa1 family insertase periplasmic-domain containing protein [Candidatus Walczuchella monophlebidarum]AID37333.1 inner membrane protein translocase component YidC [Candidatus Walczuchella monophlebidarum]